jgi:DNA repair exonuclease SbcCD ATPase subunit
MDQNEVAPVEAEEAEIEAQEESTTSEDANTEPKAETPRKPRRSVERRIDQLTAQLRQKERELEEARTKSEPKPAAAEPKREDFDDYESYVKAVARHEAKEAAAERLAEAESKAKEREARAQEENQQRSFVEAREHILEKGAEAYDDFESVTTNDDLSITPVMADALLSSEKGHELWYHLGKNPELADRIADMHPVQQLMELGRIEATLSGRKPSAAPRPTTTLNPRGSSANALSDKLSVEDWMKRRREEVRKSF